MRVLVKQMPRNHRRLVAPAGAIVREPNDVFLSVLRNRVRPLGANVFELIADSELPAGAEFDGDLQFPPERIEIIKPARERRSRASRKGT